VSLTFPNLRVGNDDYFGHHLIRARSLSWYVQTQFFRIYLPGKSHDFTFLLPESNIKEKGRRIVISRLKKKDSHHLCFW
jgi:hypothetical protein